MNHNTIWLILLTLVVIVLSIWLYIERRNIQIITGVVDLFYDICKGKMTGISIKCGGDKMMNKPTEAFIAEQKEKRNRAKNYSDWLHANGYIDQATWEHIHYGADAEYDAKVNSGNL